MSYGCQLWDYDNEYINKFYTAWHKCVRKLLGVHYMMHSRLLPGICDDIPGNDIHAVTLVCI